MEVSATAAAKRMIAVMILRTWPGLSLKAEVASS